MWKVSERSVTFIALAGAIALLFHKEFLGLWAGNPFPLHLPSAVTCFFILWFLYRWGQKLWPKGRYLLTSAGLSLFLLAQFLGKGVLFFIIPVPGALEKVHALLRFFFGQTIPLPEAKIGLPIMWLVFVAIALLFYSGARKKGKCQETKSLFLQHVVTSLILLGLILRWQALSLAIHLRLDPDAVMYRFIADKMRYLYDTSFREPLWIWTIKAWFQIFGSSDTNLRILSVFLSVGLLAVVWQFFHCFTRHTGVSLLTLAILTFHPYLILMSVRGLRLELYTIALLILAFYTFVGDPCISPRARILGLTIGGTLTILQQLNSFTFVPFFWLYAFWRYRLPWLYLLAPAGAAAALVTPYLVYCTRTFGDPLWSINVHAIWYRNYELVVVKKTGCPWYRSLAEFEKNSYLGPRITTFEYIFGMHSLKEVLSRLLAGYAKLFLYPNRYFWLQIGVKSLLAYLVYIAGLLKVLASRYRSVLLYPLLTINLLAFLVPINIDPRLVTHTTPVTAWIFASGLWLCGGEFPQWIKSRIRQERLRLAKNFLSRKR